MTAVVLSRGCVLAARLQRHGQTQPAVDESSCLELFRVLQPVSPQANSYPGSPPRLMHRTTAELADDEIADELRSRRELLKGRFQGGTVGYVCADELALYASAYRRPLERLDPKQELVLRALTYAGPLSPRELREETGLGPRPLMAAVHRLERAFVVCEESDGRRLGSPTASGGAGISRVMATGSVTGVG